MNQPEHASSRRQFIKTTALATTGALVSTGFSPAAFAVPSKKRRLALIGTGVRGIGTWAQAAVSDYKEQCELVGLCDINPGRVETARKHLGLNCPTFTNFDEMMRSVKPDALIVTTVDATHHEFIIKGLDYGCDVITEKPLTTEAANCQAILDAEARTGRKVIVTFNYRYSPHRQRMYELLREGAIGDIVSADFHWYLDVYHGADYFRRWHAFRNKSGSLLVHKATHHFDLLNWWLASEPSEVYAYGALEHYGRNNAFRHTHCRPCPHKDKCKFYWKMPDDLMRLYADNEQYDGYLRDACVWRENIDIFDKMAVQIRYANNIFVSYSLTTFSPYEGYRIAFNGTKGRLEAWIQERQPWETPDYDEIRITENFGQTRLIQVPFSEGGHGGGDTRMLDKIFKDPSAPDPYRQSAGSRDGAMSILIGIGARQSIDQQRPVRIEELTTLKPKAVR